MELETVKPIISPLFSQKNKHRQIGARKLPVYGHNSRNCFSNFHSFTAGHEDRAGQITLANRRTQNFPITVKLSNPQYSLSNVLSPTVGHQDRAGEGQRADWRLPGARRQRHEELRGAWRHRAPEAAGGSRPTGRRRQRHGARSRRRAAEGLPPRGPVLAAAGCELKAW